VTVESGRLPAEGVQRMFDRIAPVYDAMNRVMTAGLDQRWRKATVRAAVRSGDDVLDACCGTGDLAVAAVSGGAGHVIGVDFSEGMLERARRKAPDLEWVQADVLALPFEDAHFDSAVVGFGIRNVENLEAGIRELRRVLRPGGRLGILEITTPRGALAPFYKVWFDRVVPLLGRFDEAYTYLPNSVKRFPAPEALAGMLAEAGCRNVGWILTAGGIIALHHGTVA
jgi:demethylmenaquinone methyltransferase / 2-methoxy-6-polyprenyl-1,4-benzoquinol methylase